MRAIAWLTAALAATVALAPGARAGGDVTAERAAARSPDHKITRTASAMGTVVQVTFWTDDEAKAAKAAQAVFDEFDRLDRMMTTWLPDSEVSQINSAAGVKAIKVSDETYAVIERAMDVSRRSKGIFDITVGAFAGLWKFDEDMDYSLPDQAEVKKRLALVGYKNVVLDAKHHTVKLKKKGMRITLGGIAKGYAVDKAVKILVDLGYADFIMQAGGDMYVSGKKGDKPWVVGIRDPRGPRDQSFAVAPVQDHSFSTSGDYERGFVKDGVRYHHILDPRTGQPARASRSVTIRAKDAFTADAWSKVLFILGAEQAMKLVDSLDDFEAVFVDADNQVHVSSGLDGVVKVLQPPTDGT
ncbi:MAG: FAD:protein FMN transferase [Kofleriaceae bacterium]|nr:FAD:protein FMN transferase [Kofleriaceae bacterium]MCB9574901.1 FAD:protein FMN transferase [Kofleriaceae bacterium]